LTNLGSGFPETGAEDLFGFEPMEGLPEDFTDGDDLAVGFEVGLAVDFFVAAALAFEAGAAGGGGGVVPSSTTNIPFSFLSIDIIGILY